MIFGQGLGTRLTHRKVPGVEVLSNQGYGGDHGGAHVGATAAAIVITDFTVYSSCIFSPCCSSYTRKKRIKEVHGEL